MEIMELTYNLCRGCGKLIQTHESYCEECERNVYTDEKGRAALDDLLLDLHDRGFIDH